RRIDIIKRERSRVWNIQFFHQCGLSTFAQFQCESPRAIEHSRAMQFQRSHERQRQRHSASVSANISAGARLIKIERCFRDFVWIEKSMLKIEGSKFDTAAFQSGKERLLPLWVLE